MAGSRRQREARLRIQARLGLLSLLIWIALTFTLAVPLYLFTERRIIVILVGFGAVLLAGLPWLAYGRLVKAELRRIVASGGPGSP